MTSQLPNIDRKQWILSKKVKVHWNKSHRTHTKIHW